MTVSFDVLPAVHGDLMILNSLFQHTLRLVSRRITHLQAFNLLLVRILMQFILVLLFLASCYAVFLISVLHLFLYALMMLLQIYSPMVCLGLLNGFVHEMLVHRAPIQVLTGAAEWLVQCLTVALGRGGHLDLVEDNRLDLVGVILFVLLDNLFVLWLVLDIEDIDSVLVDFVIRLLCASGNLLRRALQLRLQSPLRLLKAFASAPIEAAGIPVHFFLVSIEILNRLRSRQHRLPTLSVVEVVRSALSPLLPLR